MGWEVIEMMDRMIAFLEQIWQVPKHIFRRQLSKTILEKRLLQVTSVSARNPARYWRHRKEIRDRLRRYTAS
jgi:hypothetical protein